MISLLDLADGYPLDAWVVFRNVEKSDRTWADRFLLKDGFHHVEMWVMDRGVYVRMETCFSFPVLQAYLDHPWTLLPAHLKPRCVRVRKSLGGLRTPWKFGPVTCVEAVKLALGYRAPLVRTPWQLYRYIKRTEG